MAAKVGDIVGPGEFWIIKHDGRVTDVYHLKCPEKSGFHVKMKPVQEIYGLRCPDCGIIVGR